MEFLLVEKCRKFDNECFFQHIESSCLGKNHSYIYPYRHSNTDKNSYSDTNHYVNSSRYNDSYYYS